MKTALDKRKSKIHGFGIFAQREIKKDETFYKIPLTNISDTAKPHWARIGDKYFGDEEVLNFVNHSCDPNTKIDTKALSLIAIKNIKAGEEITCDYNKTELSGVKTPCTCHSKSCRGWFMKEI